MSRRRIKRVLMRSFLNRKFGILVLIAAVCLLGAIGGRWIYNKITLRQATALNAQAWADFREGKLTKALMGVETTLRLKSDFGDAKRLQARIYAATGEGQKAMAAFQQLTEGNLLTHEDLRVFSHLAAETGEKQLAEKIAGFGARRGDRGLPHLVKAKVLLDEKRNEEAEKAIRAGVDEDPTDSSKLALLEFLLQSPKRNQSKLEIANLLEELSVRPNEVGAYALSIGLQTGLINPDKRMAWIESLRTNAKASLEQRLFADSAAQNSADRRNQVYAELLEFAQDKNLLERATIADWFSKHGRPHEALSILSSDEAAKRDDFAMVWLDAAAKAGGWSESLEFLSRSDNPLPPHTTKLFKAYAMKKLGREDQSRVLFEEVAAEDGRDSEKYSIITSYLLYADEWGLFNQKLEELKEEPFHAKALYRTLFPGVFRKRDAKLTLRVLKAIGDARYISHDAGFQLELAHHKLLLGEPVEIEPFKKQRKETPNNLHLLAVLALHQLKEGAPQTALAIFDGMGFDIDAKLVPPRILVIYAASLATNEKLQIAEAVASLIDPDMIYPEERVLLSKAMEGKAQSTPPNRTAE